MKMIDADEINLIKLAQDYSDERKARELFEAWRWPNGPVCPHCKHNEVYKITSAPNSKNKVRHGLYCCAACRKPFTATVGTVFEDSHVPISKWLMAIFILCSSKKSISAHQLHRMLKVTYRTAWFMAHRIRFAMTEDPKSMPPLANTVEADETFVGGKGPIETSSQRKTPVAAIIERGGEARTRVIASVTVKNVGQFLSDAVSKEAKVNTDEHPAYRQYFRHAGFKAHETVNHSEKEYCRKNADGSLSHVNTCESFFSLLKRGVYGAWHHVSREHLPKYTSEFQFRWNTRKVSDGKRFATFLPMIEGKRLMYRRPKN
jgi:transposase-like protein